MSETVGLNTGRARWGLSGFALKVVAALTMLCDHVGAYLFPEVLVLRIIGRLAFPIFAYFIAEGCRYTRHKLKRFLLIFGLALLCEAAYLVVYRELTGTALLTFSLSIPIVYAVQALKRALCEINGLKIVLFFFAVLGALGAAYVVSLFVAIDYGFQGVLVPVLLSLCDYREGEAPQGFRYLDNKPVRLTLFAAGLFLIWWVRGPEIQACALLTVPLMALYNGRPGRRTYKYWFYIFYPAHLLVIAGIGMLMELVR